VTIKGVKVGINICEDIWIDGAVYQAQAKAGAQVLINISSSPYQAGKIKERQELLVRRAKETKNIWSMSIPSEARMNWFLTGEAW
jgi:NAD+ synthase (glutamine-hydrolysing)